jgi:DNA-binding NarL/FixJ family response regulator
MRVLIADRNARLLESISRTFARQFAIETAASCEQCNDLLARSGFDLVLISEKLADGPGLQVLGQIVRSSPDTLRVFAARRSRLQLLKGKLGPFGLFRTLSYPINPQELLSTLTLAQTGLAIGASSPDDAPADVQPQAEAPTPPPAPAEVCPVVERISLTSADATFAIDVPQAILSQRRVRRSNSAPAHRPASAARPAPAPTAPVRNAAPESSGAARQSEKGAPQSSGAARQSQKGTPESPGAARQAQKGAPESPGAARQAQKAPPELSAAAGQTQRPTLQPTSAAAQLQPAAPQPGRPAPQQTPFAPLPARTQQRPAHSPARSQAAAVHSASPARSPSPTGPFQHAPRNHRAADRPVVASQPAYPIRSKLVLAAASVVVFVVTTLTLNLNDASVHVTRASTPRPKIELTAPPEPPAALAPAFRPEPGVARRVEPKPAVNPVGQQVTASNAPVADPSSFGHEAYEVIYEN